MNPLVGHKRAGVLLHPSSLPSGRLDQDVFRWLDWLAAAGFSVWQILPLGVPLAGVSPYQCASAFALNPNLFPEKLPAVRAESHAFKAWYAEQASWVNDYALFRVIKKQYAAASWVDWPVALCQRAPEALKQFATTHAAAIQKIIRKQYQLYAYWQKILAYAHEKNILVFGDMPLFVAHDSADVWTHKQCFLLDEQGQPTFVAGVPPDYFSATGQRWGNPQYDWSHLGCSEFLWWQERLRYHFECFDLVRLDHFRGLAASWMIPADHVTAMDGAWQTVPGAKLLRCVQKKMGKVPLVAEDLGVITPDVNALRVEFGLPGMSVLQFSFDAYADNPHKPENVTPDRVYYTGTHDNDTSLGWFESLDTEMQTKVMHSLGAQTHSEVVGMMIATVLDSAACLAMIPMQDILKLDNSARMNIPGTVDPNNWMWRFFWDDLPTELAAELHAKILQTGRLKHD